MTMIVDGSLGWNVFLTPTPIAIPVGVTMPYAAAKQETGQAVN